MREGWGGSCHSIVFCLYSMVVCGNLMTFVEIIELDPKPEQVLLCTKFLSDNFLQCMILNTLNEAFRIPYPLVLFTLHNYH